ncbi:MAG TPA: hypothetical protein PLC65_00130 [Bacteroidia bacterium]|nr:hypothetical protein [Bacteroidia bacterium]
MKSLKNKIVCLFVLLLTSLSSSSQENPIARNIFLNSETSQVIDEWSIRYPNKEFHASFKPYLSNSLTQFHDSCVGYHHYTIKNFFLSKTFNEGPSKRNQYNFQFLPLVDLQTGFDVLNNKNVNELTGGLHAKLNINDDFTLEGTGFAGNVTYPFFTDTFIQNTKLIPGLGMAYRSGNSYNYSNFSGSASYSPNKIFNLQIGNGKHFIGEGYRSLLLSDVANNYPYFRINSHFGNVQYSVWYTWMYDITGANGIKSKFQNKYATMHYLSWNPFKVFNISIFENIIWQGTEANRDRGFDVNYINPIIMYRPQEYSVGSADNAFIGINSSFRLFNCLKLYGQLALDEFLLREIRARRGWWANKQAWQLGLKYVDVFKVRGLTFQAEYNEVRPYTYTHGSIAQNYAHYGQPLAHPLGANFKEYLGFLSYRKNRFMFSAQGLYAIIGKDTAGSNLGQNIFLPYTTRPFEYGHRTTQGIKTILLQSDIRLTYFVLPQMNLRLELGYIQRSESTDKGYQLQNPYIYFGIKTSVWNFYRDY